MTDWLDNLAELRQKNTPVILITVAQTQGSTPRETGTKMIVSATDFQGTIGGGNLEYNAIEFARSLLKNNTGDNASTVQRHFALGPSLGQCCGGVANLLFEPISSCSQDWIEFLLQQRRLQQPAIIATCVETPIKAAKLIVSHSRQQGLAINQQLQQQILDSAHDLLTQDTQFTLLKDCLVDNKNQTVLFESYNPATFHITLFGAGHVGKALVNVLSGLPCAITWVDSRATCFPQQLPANVNTVHSEYPEDEADHAPAGSYFLIMTHSHPQDQAICEQALQRDDLAYCGLIGSVTKRNTFRSRLLRQGLTETDWARLTCPIGINNIDGKHPYEIAISVAAQLLQVRQRLSRYE